MDMKELAVAFIKAKKDFAPALKTSTNPHFKSKYADLSACVEAVDDSFLKHGIVMYQETFDDQTGVTVETVLLHESGQSLRCGKLHVPAPKNDPQGYGSALSYARRYSLMAACGIAPEDDDGNAASKKPTKPPVKAALEGVQIDTDTKDKLKELAADLVHYVEGCDDPVTAVNLLDDANLDHDCKLFLWDILQPNSKTRSAIKKESESRKGK